MYSKVNKKIIHKYKQHCNDRSNHIGNWCTNQKLREYLKNINSINIVGPKEIYNIRDTFLKNNIADIFKYLKNFYKHKSLNKNNIKIFPTGSSNITSDKDVQILLNLFYKFNSTELNNITNAIIKTRKENQRFFPNNKKIFDIYFDINYYTPSLFYFIRLPKSKKNFIKKIEKYCYIENISNNNKLEATVVLKPDFKNAREFLYEDCCNILKIYNMKLKKCYDSYKKKPSSAVFHIINNIHEDTPFKINNYLFDITSINNICAEMYMSICTTLYVVWYMQMNNSNSKSKQLKMDLKYLAIPAFIENHIHYIETKKGKYNLRKKQAFKDANKPLLISIIQDLIHIRGKQYSTSKITILKKLLKEIL